MRSIIWSSRSTHGPLSCVSAVPSPPSASAAETPAAETGHWPIFPVKALLTPREREVLTQIAEGASNKEVGRHLGISPRTVEVHRARIMEKIGARNAADLVRIVLSGGHGHTTSSPEMVIN